MVVRPWAVRALRGLPKAIGPSLVIWALMGGMIVFAVGQFRLQGGRILGGDILGSTSLVGGVAAPLEMPVSDLEQLRGQVDAEWAGRMATSEDGSVFSDPVPSPGFVCVVIGTRICVFGRGDVVVVGSCEEWRDLPDCTEGQL